MKKHISRWILGGLALAAVAALVPDRSEAKVVRLSFKPDDIIGPSTTITVGKLKFSAAINFYRPPQDFNRRDTYQSDLVFVSDEAKGKHRTYSWIRCYNATTRQGFDRGWRWWLNGTTAAPANQAHPCDKIPDFPQFAEFGVEDTNP